MKEAIQKALDNLAGFTPRKKTPAGLEVTVDGKQVVFLVDPLTGQVQPPKTGAWGWVKGFLYQDLQKYLANQRYEVRELSDIAPVLA